MKDSPMKVLALALGLALWSSALSASEPNFQFSSIRMQGMGGAGAAVANGENALYANPAALAQISDIVVRIAPLRFELNDAILDKQQALTDLSSSFSSEDTEAITNLIKNGLVPTKLGLNFSSIPLLSMAFNGFGMGLFGQTQLVGNFVNKTNPVFQVSGIGDGAGVVGFARNMTLFGVDLSLGVTGKYILRGRTVDKDGSNVISLGIADIISAANGTSPSVNIQAGSGFGFDCAVMGTLEVPFVGKVKTALVLNNVGTSISGSDINGNAFTTTIPMLPTLGLGFDSSLPFIGDFVTAVDYQFDSNSQDMFKNIHAGFEKSVWIFALRGGINQGYLTLGMGTDLFWILHLNYAYTTTAFGKKVGLDESSFHVVELRFLF